MNINITAATGNLGIKITEEALRYISASNLILSVRNPEKALDFHKRGVTVRSGDYNNIDELIEAYKDTDVLIYIPSITFPSSVRIAEFENFVEAAEQAKVKHVIFVGFIADQENNPFKMSPFFGFATRRLASSNLKYTLVRNAMYADPLIPYLPELKERKSLVYPVGDEKISFISREDIAKAVIQIALNPEFQGERYTLTGSEAYTMDELANLLSETAKAEIKYHAMTVKEFSKTYDQPEGFGEVLASLYVAASKGLMKEVTNDFNLLTSKSPELLINFLSRKYNDRA